MLVLCSKVSAAQPAEALWLNDDNVTLQAVCAKSSDPNCIYETIRLALDKQQYNKVNAWLSESIVSRNTPHSDADVYLENLLCQGEMREGDAPIKPDEREVVMQITNKLMALGASVETMPTGIVTILYCVINRQDSEFLTWILNTHAHYTNAEMLNSCLYEGQEMAHVPLYRTVLNNDLASAKILLEYGANPDFSYYDLLNNDELVSGYENQTSLLIALSKNNVAFANWLLDVGASIQIGDKGKCKGNLPLDFAKKIPIAIIGRNVLIQRITTLMQLPENRCD
ncbi:MAG: hypothetical protein RI964_3302 [Pseudomonadota bacterium]